MTSPVTSAQLARAVAQAARGVAGVADLDAGSVGEFATYGDGGRVPGVRARAPREGGAARVALRLVARFGYPLPEVADQVRARVSEVVGRLTGVADVPIDLHIVDVRSDDEEPAALPADTSPASPARP